MLTVGARPRALILLGLIILAGGASLAAARPLSPSTGRALLDTDLDQMNAHVCRKGGSTVCSQLEGYSSDCGALCAYDFGWCSEATQFGLKAIGFGLLGINECP